MKKLWMPLALLFLVTISGCLTTKIEYVTVKPEFDIPPERVELEEVETIQGLADLVVYYEELLSEWESWGISVYESVDLPLPDSLKLIKSNTGE